MSIGWSRGGGPRISVDNDRCELFGLCEAEAPDVFELSTDGKLRFRRTLGEDTMEQAINAARNCPMQAIVLKGGLLHE